jgi:hypothetical protein
MHPFIPAKFLLLLLIPGWLTYTDQAHKFTIQYPKEWTQQAQGNVLMFLSPRADATDQFQENVNIILQDLSAQPMNLEQYTALSKKQISDAYGANAVISQGPATIAGQKGEYLIYNMTYNGRPLKIKSYWFIKGKMAYLFTYTAEPPQFEKYDQTATAIINSFTFL